MQPVMTLMCFLMTPASSASLIWHTSAQESQQCALKVYNLLLAKSRNGVSGNRLSYNCAGLL